MSAQEVTAGKLWVERRFLEIAREFGAPRTLTQEDRWRETEKSPTPHWYCMAYYIELAGHLKRGELIFRELDLEIAGAGEQKAQERLARQIRDVLISLGEVENPAGKPPPHVTRWL